MNDLCIQKDVISVNEKINHSRLASPKQQVRRTESGDNRLQNQQLPALNTQHLSQAKPDFSPLSPVSTQLAISSSSVASPGL